MKGMWGTLTDALNVFQCINVVPYTTSTYAGQQKLVQSQFEYDTKSFTLMKISNVYLLTMRVDHSMK